MYLFNFVYSSGSSRFLLWLHRHSKNNFQSLQSKCWPRKANIDELAQYWNMSHTIHLMTKSINPSWIYCVNFTVSKCFWVVQLQQVFVTLQIYIQTWQVHCHKVTNSLEKVSYPPPVVAVLCRQYYCLSAALATSLLWIDPNYGVISGSHACRDCVWPIILDTELYATCPGEQVLLAIRFNVTFLPLGPVTKKYVPVSRKRQKV